MVEDGAVENVYRVLVMNATEAPQRYRIAVAGLPGLSVGGDTELELAPAAERSMPVSVRLPAEAATALHERTQHIRFEVTQVTDAGPAASVREASTFLLPR
jgi:polyferredoxin